MAEKNSGIVFNHTKNYSLNQKEVKKFLNYYFTNKELKNKIILDAGCRVGDYSIGLIKKGAKFVKGIDLSEECIKTTKKKYLKNKKLNFQTGNITNLPMFKDSTFDIVICVGTIFYLPPEGMKKALKEFIRLTKPNGTILILFHKEKGVLGNTARFIANKIPLKIYLFLIEYFAFLLRPLVNKLIDRKVNINYLKYDILLSLRGIHFGIPISIPERFRMKTVTCENCSEKTTTSYKIKVSKNKKELLN